MSNWSNFFPGTKWIEIGNDIRYRLHKHWGMGVYAGEGLFIHRGDRSGCLTDFDIGGQPINRENPSLGTTCRPKVVLQRIYQKGQKQLSAVFSYPDGLSSVDRYFWEIYPVEDGDIEQFDEEEAMEQRIRELLR